MSIVKTYGKNIRVIGLVIVAILSLSGIETAMAQSAPAATPSPPVAATLTKDGKPRAKEVREQCRAEAKAKGIQRGEAFRAHMKQCIGAKRPDLVKAFECREEAKAKGLEKPAIKAYVKECRSKAAK